jgi:gliding motility-associated protein GldC
MKKSEIRLIVELDEENIPEKISWDADDKDSEGLIETPAFNLNIWDGVNRNTLRIDLWTKDMPVDEMKRFFIDSLGGLAQSILNSTGDEYMAEETNALCERLVKYLKIENSTQK